MNTQSRDIAKAIAALQALQVKTEASRVSTMERQIDSYEQHKTIAKEAAEIAADFLTEICASAASLGDDNDSAAIRDTFNACISDAVDDAFHLADAWADEVRQEHGLEDAA
jgi:hypothetical protein